MTGSAAAAATGAGDWRLPAANSAAWPRAALVLLLCAQFSLIFTKSFNWDEFFHFSMVYQFRDGTLTQPFQSLLARLLAWTPAVSDDLLSQMMAARVFAWSAFLVGLGSLYGLARQFAGREDAVWTTLVYLGAGNVFAHGFAIRADPVAMAALMLALYLLATRPVGWGMVLAIGGLVGFAAVTTVKTVFYAPCFAGIAWLRFASAGEKRRTLAWLSAILPVSAATFGALYLYHRAGLAPAPAHHEGGAFLTNGLQWLSEGLIPQPRHALVAFVTAPVLAYALIKTPAVCRRDVSDRHQIVAIAGLCLPLLVVLFYRNVFPYFFVFLLAPVAAALGPALGDLRRRHGSAALAAAICAVPLVKLAAEPRDVLPRQRALVDYVHRQLPAGASYLDHSGIVADRPRVVDHLLSGIGLANYRERGVPLVARAVEAGRLALVIDNHAAISHALAGEHGPDSLLPADIDALRGNYVRAWGNVWLAGEAVPAGEAGHVIALPAAGAYVVDGAAVTIDGAAYPRGAVATLAAGRHAVTGHRSAPVVLWRGQGRPASPPEASPGILFTDY